MASATVPERSDIYPINQWQTEQDSDVTDTSEHRKAKRREFQEMCVNASRSCFLQLG